MTTHTPRDDKDLVDLIAHAPGSKEKLTIQGGGSKAEVGAPTPDAAVLDMTRFAGVIDYDPAELVLTVKAATPLAEVQSLVAAQGQMLAFDPFDHGRMFGKAAGRATIGGVIGGGVAGSRRVSSGSARDHLLGFRAVSGRGEAFIAGAKVVKNVTGFDLPKLAAGSWGRLFALTELTLKVLPQPRETVTVQACRLDPRQAVSAMAAAMSSQADIAAAAHLPTHGDSGTPVTIFRLEGFGPSIAARLTILDRTLADRCAVEQLAAEQAEKFWWDLQALRSLGTEQTLWRINVPPSQGPIVAAFVERLGASWLFDWAGGLVWVACDGQEAAIREAATQAGGHAMLLRAPAPVRAAIPALQPQGEGITTLETRIRRAFDPEGIFETGRF